MNKVNIYFLQLYFINVSYLNKSFYNIFSDYSTIYNLFFIEKQDFYFNVSFFSIKKFSFD